METQIRNSIGISEETNIETQTKLEELAKMISGLKRRLKK